MFRILKIILVALVIFIVVALIGVQLMAGAFIKPALERQLRVMFQSPVNVEKAGIDVLSGTVWVKHLRVKNAPGFHETDFLRAGKASLSVSLPSLLTSALVVNRIYLREPEILIEVDESGARNMTYFNDHLSHWFDKFSKKKRKLIKLITSYELEKFSVREGRLLWKDRRKQDRDMVFRVESFSLARILYPPDPEEALPAAVYLNAQLKGARQGQALVLGRFHPFAQQQSFDITGSFKNVDLKGYHILVPNFPLEVTGGVLQLKLKAICHDDQVDIHHQLGIKDIEVQLAPSGRQGDAAPAFNLPPETILFFFNEIKPKHEPFKLDYHVRGNLADPDFSLLAALIGGFHDQVEQVIGREVKPLEESLQLIGG